MNKIKRSKKLLKAAFAVLFREKNFCCFRSLPRASHLPSRCFSLHQSHFIPPVILIFPPRTGTRLVKTSGTIMRRRHHDIQTTKLLPAKCNTMCGKTLQPVLWAVAALFSKIGGAHYLSPLIILP
ncbi:MAG TPA: hypothetical protein VK769_05220 [Verrucomicrobiae bacterium]|nr:hypothetical protein [Verrucomicrobiae bacterium]